MSGLGIKLGIACGICLATANSTQARIALDWSEGECIWTTQSYWHDDDILQKYTFTPNRDDRVAGEFSVQVDMEIDGLRATTLPPLSERLRAAAAKVDRQFWKWRAKYPSATCRPDRLTGGTWR